MRDLFFSPIGQLAGAALATAACVVAVAVIAMQLPALVRWCDANVLRGIPGGVVVPFAIAAIAATLATGRRTTS